MCLLKLASLCVFVHVKFPVVHVNVGTLPRRIAWPTRADTSVHTTCLGSTRKIIPYGLTNLVPFVQSKCLTSPSVLSLFFLLNN